jgi:hypothetical protein
MKKPIQEELPDLNEDQMTTELIELTCDDLDSLTRAFEMISDLCNSLQCEVAEDIDEPIPPRLIN